MILELDRFSTKETPKSSMILTQIAQYAAMRETGAERNKIKVQLKERDPSSIH